MKPRVTTKYIVVHNLATSPSMDWGWAEVDRDHRSRGWLMGGYHYVIKRDGDLQTGRPIEVPGAHCRGHNVHSVAVALSGGIAERKATKADPQVARDRGWVPQPDKPENNFTDQQFNTLAATLFHLRSLYPEAQIVGHGELDAGKPHCPGFNLAGFLMEHGLGN